MVELLPKSADFGLPGGKPSITGETGDQKEKPNPKDKGKSKNAQKKKYRTKGGW